MFSVVVLAVIAAVSAQEECQVTRTPAGTFHYPDCDMGGSSWKQKPTGWTGASIGDVDCGLGDNWQSALVDVYGSAHGIQSDTDCGNACSFTETMTTNVAQQRWTGSYTSKFDLVPGLTPRWACAGKDKRITACELRQHGGSPSLNLADCKARCENENLYTSCGKRITDGCQAIAWGPKTEEADGNLVGTCKLYQPRGISCSGWGVGPTLEDVKTWEAIYDEDGTDIYYLDVNGYMANEAHECGAAPPAGCNITTAINYNPMATEQRDCLLNCKQLTNRIMMNNFCLESPDEPLDHCKSIIHGDWKCANQTELGDKRFPACPTTEELAAWAVDGYRNSDFLYVQGFGTDFSRHQVLVGQANATIVETEPGTEWAPAAESGNTECDVAGGKFFTQAQATAACAAKGEGWRLPTVAEAATKLGEMTDAEKEAFFPSTGNGNTNCQLGQTTGGLWWTSSCASATSCGAIHKTSQGFSVTSDASMYALYLYGAHCVRTSAGSGSTIGPVAIANCTQPAGDKEIDPVTGNAIPWNMTDYMKSCAKTFCGANTGAIASPSGSFDTCATCFDQWAGDDATNAWYDGGNARAACMNGVNIPEGTTPDGYYQWNAAASEYVQVTSDGDAAGQYKISGAKVLSKTADGSYASVTRSNLFTTQLVAEPKRAFGKFGGDPVVAYPVKDCDGSLTASLEMGSEQELRAAAAQKVTTDGAADAVVDSVLDHIIA